MFLQKVSSGIEKVRNGSSEFTNIKEASVGDGERTDEPLMQCEGSVA